MSPQTTLPEVLDAAAAREMANVPEFVEIWFGIARSACVEVPVHSAYRGPLLEHILGESGARILFCDAEFVTRLAGLALPALALAGLRACAGSDRNLMPLLIDAARVHVSEGEIIQALQDVWGDYREAPVF